MSKVKDIPTKSTTLSDSDSLLGVDSAASSVTRRFTLEAIRLWLKSYADYLYAAISHTHPHNGTVGVVYIGSSAPSNPQTGDLWIDTSEE